MGAERQVEVVLPGVARSARSARRLLSETLQKWGAEGYADAASLALDEMVVNAVLHARTEMTVRLRLDDDCLRLEVSDGSPRPPVRRRHSRTATTGRGLALVGAVSRRWGVERQGDGKTVWAELDATSTASDSAPSDSESFDSESSGSVSPGRRGDDGLDARLDDGEEEGGATGARASGLPARLLSGRAA